MYFQIVDIYSGPGNLIYARVDYWAAAEDKLLGLQPATKNDFLTDNHCPDELIRQVKMFGQRAKSLGMFGDLTTHFPNHKHSLSPELLKLINRQGACE